MKNSEPIKILRIFNYLIFPVFLSLLFSLPLSMYAQETCTYQLKLVDSFGDGWDDSFVVVSINGNATNYTLGDGDDDEAEQVIDLLVATNEALTIRYGTEGTATFQNEISYSLLDSEGFVLFEDGPSPADGLVFTAAVFCPTCTALDQNKIELDNITASSVSVNSSIGTGEQVQIEYGPIGFEQGTGQQLVSSNTTINLTGLAENTDYAIYLNKLCADGAQSRYIGPLLFKTPFINPPDTCFYSLRLLDLFGDGWNGASMGVSINGVIETYTLPDGFRADIELAALSNIPIQITFNGGPFDEEVSYIVLDPAGETIISDGPSPDTGLVVNLIACPSCPVPDSVQIDPSALTANLSWEELNTDFYVLEYGKKGFELGTGLEVIAQNAATVLTNLAEKTDYEVYLYSVCSEQDTSVQTLGPLAFQTGYLKDVGIDKITMPVTSCGLGISEMIEVELKNYGANPQSLIPFKFSVNGVDGGVPVPTDGFYTGILSKDSSTIIQFETPTDLMATGIYEIAVWTELEGDSDASNDTTILVVTNIPTIQNFPYGDNFDTNVGGWTMSSDSKNGSWEYGVPNGKQLTNAFSGQAAWVTNLAGSYNESELSYLLSPCLDFSTLTEDPIIAFRYFFNAPISGDTKAWLEVSKNGERWIRVGKEGLNWYNEDGQTNWGGNASLGTWLYAEDVLQKTAGVGDIRLRFVFAADDAVTTTDGFAIDDIHIFPKDVPNMVARLAFNTAKDGCGSAVDSVALLLRNSGQDTISQLALGYQINNGAITIEQLDTLIAPKASITYPFQTTFNSSVIGLYQIKSWVTLTGDAVPISDTTYNYFEVLPPNPLPLIEDFDDAAVDNGWIALQGSGTFSGANDHNNETIILSSNMWFGNATLEFVTANYGPINAGDSLSFDYRFADWPSATEGKTLIGDSLQVAISTDCGSTYTPIYTVQEGNHEITADFTTIKLSLEEYIGQGVSFKFLTTWGDGDYWFDIDNINVLGCPNNLGLTAAIIDATGEAAADGSIQIIPTQGAGGYDYVWQITEENTDSVGNLLPGDYRVKVVDTLLGCEDFLTVTVGILTTTVTNLAIVEQLQLYPNPTNGSAHLLLALYEPQAVGIEVFNIMGQSLLQMNLDSNTRIQQNLNLANYSKGVYWVKITIGTQQITRRLMRL